MSLDARGTFHRILTFTANRSTAVAKRKNTRSNPFTVPQRGHRSMLKHVVSMWSWMNPTMKATWATSAPPDEHSAYHWYVKFNLERWRRGKAPCTNYALRDLGTVPTLAAWSLTQHHGYVRLIWPPAGYTNVLTVTWHRNRPVAFTPTPATAIHTSRWIIIRDTLIVDRPTTPGTYWYRLVVQNTNGVQYVHPGYNSISIT
jgi:hypothetical protein